jgi:murein L,D-transpeptidase YafK
MRLAWMCLCVLAGCCSAASASPSLRQADLVVIEKSKRTLKLYAQGEQIASFWVSLGREPVGRKECQGDNRTPEGFYQVVGRKENSDFHRALRISYPSDYDIAHAQAKGCDPGGDIMIHGLRVETPWTRKVHRQTDWTRGCIAVTNEEIERIWQLVPDGAHVEIRP